MKIRIFLSGIIVLFTCCIQVSDGQTEKLSPQTQETRRKVASLIENLNGVSDSRGYQIAIDLAKHKGDATELLIEGLSSPDSTTRKYCARAITNIVGGYNDYSGRHLVKAARLPLLEALAVEKDRSAAWFMTQAIKSSKPDAAEALPVLIESLKVSTKSKNGLSHMVVETIGSYEKESIEALPVLSKLYQTTEDDWLRRTVLTALNDIGMDEASLEVVARTKVATIRTSANVVEILLKYPERAIEFLNLHPEGLANFDDGFGNQIDKVFEDGSTELKSLRDYLASREDLPVTTRVRIGTPEQLKKIESQIETMADDPHRRSFFRACARVLGDKPVRAIVEISDNKKGDFRPESAHPGVSKLRQNDNFGHGDGITRVMISGTLTLADGSPAINPKFYAANDRMLLGREQKKETLLFKYDEDTGRFAYLTSVFAAYSLGDGQREPGPYQTGSANTLIESDNSAPLCVEFFDEMPEVKITLPKK